MTEREGGRVTPTPTNNAPAPDILVETTAADNKVTHRQIDKIMYRALRLHQNSLQTQ